MIQFLYPEVSQPSRNWWLVVDGGEVDLCKVDPGFDLMVTGSLKIMTAIWMGITGVRRELDAGHLQLDGDPSVARAMQAWLGLGTFAAWQRRVS